MPKIHRRNFLRSSGLGLTGLALGACSSSKEDTPSPAKGEPSPDSGSYDTGENTDTQTDTGLDTGNEPVVLADTGPTLPRKTPVSLTTANDAELDIDLNLLSGTLPTDMKGHGFLVHPIPPGGGNPIFNGNGQVIRMDFHPDKVSLHSRTAKTPCWFADEASKNRSFGFSTSGLMRISTTLGIRNMANTAFQVMGDRLLLTNDAGRPHELDPESLEVVTPVGRNEHWASALPNWIGWFTHWPFPLVMSTAHPGYDHETGEIFSVSYGLPILGMGIFTRLVGWDGEGELTTWNVVDRWGQSLEIQQSVHQMAITRNYIVIMDTAFLVEMTSLLLPGSSRAQSPDTHIHIIKRSDLPQGGGDVTAMTVTIPREAAHFLADFDDSDDKITLHLAHNCAADPSEFLSDADVRADTGAPINPLLKGLPASATDLGGLGRYVVDARSGMVLETDLLFDELSWGGPALVTWPGNRSPDRYQDLWWISLGFNEDLRLKRVEELYADYPYRRVPLSSLPTDGKPASLVRLDAQNLQIVDSYTFPDGRVALSPLFVPREGGNTESDGYIVCTVISDDSQTPGSTGDEIWIFDAEILAQGPLARLGHEQLDMPFTLHTTWMETAPTRSATYELNVRSELSEEVAYHSSEIQAIFETQVYPNF
ncbi:MAG: carotenoid oxygenase family protein [Myxococcota bacterium]|nr:carotenoid oxygenase family protein [Myxococcota bacterium]